ncbi:MAG: fused MFS/spermidine synthase [Synergistaceae bacterium]|nr:fused MFS/spermidine synthase [Synergistaceae bacterium]
MESDKKKVRKPDYVKPDYTNGKKTGRSWTLEIASFTCGASVMVLEMAGSRVVAPYIGTSIIVWTSLIGVVLASLSLGYWLGGKAADLRPDQKVLARIVLLASFCTGLMAFLSNPVLRVLSRNINSVYLSSVIGSFLLFAPPSVLLGMVSPFIVRLAIRDVGSAGATVGRFSALSSAGSILGTFLGGFVLISFLSSGAILFLVAAVLAFIAFLLYRSVWKKAGVFCAAFLTFSCGVIVWGMPMMPPGEHIDTPYNHIWIAEHTRANGRRARFLMTDAFSEGAQSIIYTDNPSELVSEYTKFYDLAFHYNPDAKNILMLGGGGYCVPRHLLVTRLDEAGLPAFSMDVVEIDPGITAAARKYFSLQDSPALNIHHEDARVFLNRAAANPETRGSYDAIFTDVFGSWYSIPFHVATVEAAQRMADILAPDGVLVSNVISSLTGRRSGVFHGIYAALSEVFPHILIFQAQRPGPAFAQTRQNLIIVAMKKPPGEHLTTRDEEMERLLSYHWTAPFTPEVGAFTDAFAPVEIYSLR